MHNHTPAQYAASIARSLLHIEALRFSPEKPYTWASGWRSPVYCDNRLTLSYPAVRELICNAFLSVIQHYSLRVEAICGVATGGVPLGMLLADRLKLPYLYVRPSPKSYGLGNQVEGRAVPGQRVMLIEDLVSTGKSSLQAVQGVRAAGLEVVALASIFTYGFPQASRAFGEQAVTAYALCSLEQLMAVAQEMNLLNAPTVQAIRTWSAEPEAWSAAHALR